MNIKKKALSLAVIAGLTFSCVPQAQANAGHVGASTFLTTALIFGAYVNGIQSYIASPSNQLVAALMLAGVTSGAIAEWYEYAKSNIRQDVIEGMAAGIFLSTIGILFATIDQVASR